MSELVEKQTAFFAAHNLPFVGTGYAITEDWRNTMPGREPDTANCA